MSLKAVKVRSPKPEGCYVIIKNSTHIYIYIYIYIYIEVCMYTHTEVDGCLGYFGNLGFRIPCRTRSGSALTRHPWHEDREGDLHPGFRHSVCSFGRLYGPCALRFSSYRNGKPQIARLQGKPSTAAKAPPGGRVPLFRFTV